MGTDTRARTSGDNMGTSPSQRRDVFSEGEGGDEGVGGVTSSET